MEQIMANATKIRIQEILIFLFFIVFPFGQLLRTDFFIADFFGVIHPIDIVVGLSALFYLLFVKKQKPFFSIVVFSCYMFFSLILSLRIFKPQGLAEGLFYALRLSGYLIFPLFISNYLKNVRSLKLKIDNYLLGAMLFVALIGWVQYFLFPDTRFLSLLGWDDHLYRLVGSFFDPGFLSILLTFAVITAIYKYIHTKRQGYLYMIILFLITLFFTYSRSGYIAFTISGLYLLIKEKKYKVMLSLISLIFIILLILPRPDGEGVKLERLYSVYLRLQNYEETISIIKKNPVFGVGYNNLCLSRYYYLGDIETSSHACSGSDSSILLVLSTMGIVGLFIFVALIYEYNIYIKDDRILINSLVLSLFIHSLFTNSLFYPWVMGYVGIIVGSRLSTSNIEE